MNRHPNAGNNATRGVLRVSLVSGLDTSGRHGITRLLAGVGQEGPAADEIFDDSDNSTEFGLHLADELLTAARRGATGHTLIELEQHADVMEIGFVLEAQFEDRRPDGPAPVLGELITAVASRDVDRWLLSATPTPADDFDTAEQLASQLEFATVIVITDADTVTPDALGSTIGLLHRLNPCARVVRHSELAAIRQRVPAGAGCARRTGQRMGWMLALMGHPVTSHARHNVDALSYRDPRPFHPERLSDAIREQLTPSRVGRIARSRGLVQLATRPDEMGSWKSAGDTVSLDPTGMSSWDSNSPAGQEMVFFGENLDRHLITTTLNACLLTDQELLTSPMHWPRYADPFPTWPTEHHH
jgi:G3E family GTPase